MPARPVPPRRAAPVVAFLVLAALGLAACGSPITGADSIDDARGSWQLATGRVDGTTIEVPDGHRVTLVVDGDQLGGTAACNNYGGVWDGARLDRLSMTEMACEPAALMTAEATYLEGLGRVTAVVRDGDTLTLAGDDVDLQFVATPPVPVAELVGTTWVLTTLLDAETASSPAGDRAVLTLHDDGTLSGSTGCRTLRGTWTTTGDEVLFPDFAADGDCPPELAAQDDHVVGVLGDGFRVEIADRQLTVTSRDGQGLVYDGPPPS